MTRPPLRCLPSPGPNCGPPRPTAEASQGAPPLAVSAAHTAPDADAGAGGCPLCGNAADAAFWSGSPAMEEAGAFAANRRRDWVRCAGCSLLRVARPVPPALLERWRARVPSVTRPPDPARFATEVAEADEELRALREVGHGSAWKRRGAVPPQPRLLELGSGHGAFLAAAGWRGFAAVGLEPDVSKARWCARHVEAEVHAASVEAGVPEGLFDVVVLRHPLDEVLDPLALLRSLSAQIESGGLLVLSVDLLDHPIHRLQGASSALWSHPPRRLLFERRTLALALLRARLQPERLDHVPRHPGMVTVYARRDPR